MNGRLGVDGIDRLHGHAHFSSTRTTLSRLGAPSGTFLPRNVTSVAVKQPIDGLMLSNSIRAAVTGFARTLANEVARSGVTVNNVLPGYTRTDRLVSLAEKLAGDGRPAADALARWEAEIPMGRIGEPAELAALVAFLCSERAGYLTGCSIPVDGGWVRGLM